MTEVNVRVNERKLMKELTCTIAVTVKRDWRCSLGLWLAKIGLHLTGVQVIVAELPEEDA